MPRRLATQRHFGTIDLKNPRIAARSAQSSGYPGARKKPEFHQPPRFVAGKVDSSYDPGFAAAQIEQRR